MLHTYFWSTEARDRILKEKKFVGLDGPENQYTFVCNQ